MNLYKKILNLYINNMCNKQYSGFTPKQKKINIYNIIKYVKIEKKINDLI